MSFHATLPFLLFQSVWVVDDNGGPGVDFIDIQPAIADAANVDILLVKAGTYSPFTLTGKGLRILGDGAQVTKVGGNPPGTALPTVVSSGPSASFVFIEGLHFRTTDSFGGESPALKISGAGTRVALRDLIVGQANLGFGSTVALQPGLSVDSALAHVFDSSVFGTHDFDCNQDSGSALRVSLGGRVHVAGSSFLASGPYCCSPFSACPSNGGPGIHVAPAAFGPPTRAWIADSTVQGGNSSSINSTSGPGPGLRVDSAIVRVSGDGTSLVQGGQDCSGPSGAGILPTGSAEVVVHSTPVLGGPCPSQPRLPAAGPGITLDAPPLPVLRATGQFTLSGSVTLALTNGPPGAPFAIALDQEPAHFGIPGPVLGEILIGPPPSLMFLTGSLSPAGDFSVTIPLSGAPPNLAYVPLFLQGATFDVGTSTWRLSNAAVVLLRP